MNVEFVVNLLRLVRLQAVRLLGIVRDVGLLFISFWRSSKSMRNGLKRCGENENETE